ncbi:putative bifunctional diguanylate cyclase/phosphodiesterase [Sphingoaurantiacus capsulatus]|uniref:Bifunctional diguanylate cyclase/phosphodiesterase n=1 Tax=Sphingoaurantiacus capsulatus TaxID=1771310 RepID=A0ABV7XA27_9SPHN
MALLTALLAFAAPAAGLPSVSVLGPGARLLAVGLLLTTIFNLVAVMMLFRAVRRLREERAATTGPPLTATPDRDLATEDALWEWQVGTIAVVWGRAIGELFGYPQARAGTTIDWFVDKLHPDERRRAIGSLRRALAGRDDGWRAEVRFRKADGSYAATLARARIMRDASGAPLRVIGTLADISDQRRTEAALRWKANHDPVTGLPNRGHFLGRLEAALAQAGKEQVGLVLLGIDNFKAIKDAWGIAATEALLQAFGDQLIRLVPPGSLVGRVGDDEFAILLPRLSADEATLAAVSTIGAALIPSFAFEGAAIDCTASVGGAFAPSDGNDAATLWRSADLALQDARAAGRGLTRVFRADLRTSIEQRASMILTARDAITDDRIVPFYQVKVDLKTCAIVGFEALLRWHHHRHGLQPPKAIDAAFDDMELAARLTDRMIDRVIADARGWLDRGIDFRRIAINGSAPDFVRGDFAERLLDRLHQANLPPTRFELEVTESVFIGQIADNVGRILTTLSKAGTTIALDDFGTGYASLSHIKQFPVDTLKIDQSFISARAADDLDDLAIVRAVIGLGQSLGISTVAEGVESLAQANLLRREGCDVGQGYLFGRAVAAARVPDVIAELPSRWRVDADGRIRAAVDADQRAGDA